MAAAQPNPKAPQPSPKAPPPAPKAALAPAAAQPSVPTVAPESMTDRERRYYILALVTMAMSDKTTSPEEMDFVSAVCKRLRCRLDKADIRSYDLNKIAEVLQKPAIQAAVFQDLIQMAKADRVWTKEELETLKFFAERWKQPLPALTGVDWGKVAACKVEDVQKLSQEKRATLEKKQDELLKKTDPGFRWFWSIAALVIFAISLAVSLVIASIVWRAPTLDDVVNIEKALIAVFLIPCAVSGMVIGLVSPGRTIREPAVGIVSPIVLAFGFLAAFVLPGHEGAGYGVLAMGCGAAAAAMLVVTLIGAWIGEKLQGN